MGNTFGNIFRVTTFGESHGPAIGAVLDGVPSGIRIDTDEMAREMARRRPGASPLTTPRKEADEVEILSGVFEGYTTGAPVAMLIKNTDTRSRDYEAIRDTFRPGHADLTWMLRYGIRDYRGGGRTSGRETAARVAAGAVAKQVIREYEPETVISSAILEIGGEKDPGKFDGVIKEAMKDGESVGGIVEVRVHGFAAGIGEPVFDKIDALLAHAMLSIGAVKGIEFGEGFNAARLCGSENNDQMEGDPPEYVSNHAGGILGGITNGEDIVFRIAVKPTPSIRKTQHTMNSDFEETEISVPGRHDPCIALRIGPVAEAMTAITLLDALLAKRANE